MQTKIHSCIFFFFLQEGKTVSQTWINPGSRLKGALWLIHVCETESVYSWGESAAAHWTELSQRQMCSCRCPDGSLQGEKKKTQFLLREMRGERSGTDSCQKQISNKS